VKGVLMPGASIHRLSWDANTEPELAGYKVYMGRRSMIYDAEIDVGNVTSYELTIPEGGQCFFAVKAYDTSGNCGDCIAHVSDSA
jgi:hypothetical protein